MNKNNMTKCVLVAIVMVFFNQNSFAHAKNVNPIPASFKSNISTDTSIVLSVTEMSCKTDAKMVQTALYRKAGVKKVVLNEDTITVTFNSQKISLKEIIRVIENTGTCEDPNAKVHKVKVKS